MPTWSLLILLSAVCLGIYDVAKKHAVTANAVLPTLFLTTCSGSLFFLACTLFSGNVTSALACTTTTYSLVLAKSALVGASWFCVFSAMHSMPISLAAPIRSTSPLWTFLGSLLLYREFPTVTQGFGMGAIFLGYSLFSVLGRKEGFSLHHRGMLWIFAGTLLGAASALYDKYLLGVLQLNRQMVQFYFSANLVLLTGCGALYCRRKWREFSWRWSIPVTGCLLIVADWLYFYALSLPEVRISILSFMRRCGVLIAFGLGAWLFHEKNCGQKTWCLLLILLGVLLLGIRL